MPMQEHVNILATNLVKEVETTRLLKRKLSLRLRGTDRTVILYSIRHSTYTIQGSHKLSNLLNVTQSDSL